MQSTKAQAEKQVLELQKTSKQEGEIIYEKCDSATLSPVNRSL